MVSRPARGLLAPLLTSLLISPLPSLHANGVESIQLDIVALDHSLSCNRTFFRSNSHYKHTIFMLPKVVASGGPLYKRTYEIIPTKDKNTFLLNLHLYFPEDDDQLNAKGASSFVARPVDCSNPDVVKAALNSDITDPSERVDVVADLPLSSIEVVLAGFKHMARIGRAMDPDVMAKPPVGATDKNAGADSKKMADEVDILGYKADVLTATFQIDAAEAEYFQQQVTDPDGISGYIEMRFQGKARDGAVKATLNTEALSVAFAAAVKGKGSVLSKADVSAALRSSLDSRSLQVISEAGTSDASAKITQQFVDQVIKDMETQIDLASAKADSADDSGGVISVKAAVDLIKYKLNRTLGYEGFAKAEVARAQVPLRIKVTSIRDMNTLDVEVKADYTSPSTGMSLKAGQTMTMTPSDWYVDKFNYPADSATASYFTSADLLKYNLNQKFDVLRDSSLTITDQPVLKVKSLLPQDTTIDALKSAGIPVNGRVMAVGKQASFIGITYPGEYRWLHVQYPPVPQRMQSGKIPRDEAIVRKLPVGMSFGAFGGRTIYSFDDLFQENEWWAASYDTFTGRILLTAKRDLGLVAFRELMHEQTEDEKRQGLSSVDVAYGPAQTKTAVFQEFRDWRGAVTKNEPVALDVDVHPMILQKTILIAVTRPENMNESTELLPTGRKARTPQDPSQPGQPVLNPPENSPEAPQP